MQTIIWNCWTNQKTKSTITILKAIKFNTLWDHPRTLQTRIPLGSGRFLWAHKGHIRSHVEPSTGNNNRYDWITFNHSNFILQLSPSTPFLFLTCNIFQNYKRDKGKLFTIKSAEEKNVKITLSLAELETRKKIQSITQPHKKIKHRQGRAEAHY